MRDLTGQISCPGYRLPLPRQKENNSPVARRWIKQAHLLRTIVTFKTLNLQLPISLTAIMTYLAIQYVPHY